MAAAVPVALGAVQIIDSFIKDGKLKKQAAELEKNKPIKQTSQFDKDALALTESELANGMSSAAEKAYNDSVDRGLSSSISAMLKSGGNVNSIGDIYGATEQGRQNLAIMQDQMRLTQLQNVLKSYDKMASEDEKNWMVNLYGPYKDKLQAIGEQRKAAAQQRVAGINTMGGGLMTALGGDGKLKDVDTNGGVSVNTNALTGSGYGTPASLIPETRTPQDLMYLTRGGINPNTNNFLLNNGNNDAFSNFWNTFQKI